MINSFFYSFRSCFLVGYRANTKIVTFHQAAC